MAVVSRNVDKDEQFTCTCQENGKNFKCKHSIAIALLHRVLEPPVEATNYLPIKRPRGRPAKVAPQFHLAPPRLQHLDNSSSLMLLPNEDVGNLRMVFEEMVDDSSETSSK